MKRSVTTNDENQEIPTQAGRQSAIHAASVSPDTNLWRVSQTHLLAEIAKVQAAKEKHSSPMIRRPIGFRQEAEFES